MPSPKDKEFNLAIEAFLRTEAGAECIRTYKRLFGFKNIIELRILVAEATEGRLIEDEVFAYWWHQIKHQEDEQ